jgi:hypothetical protein
MFCVRPWKKIRSNVTVKLIQFVTVRFRRWHFQGYLDPKILCYGEESIELFLRHVHFTLYSTVVLTLRYLIRDKT